MRVSEGTREDVVSRWISMIGAVALLGASLGGCKDMAEKGEAFQGTLGVNQREVKTCFEHQRLDDPTLTGKIELAWTVGADGTVSGVDVASNSTGNEDLAKCVSRRVTQWQFEGTGEDRQVTHAFTFQ